MAIGFGSYNYVFYLLLTWLPSYLSAALHIDLLHSFLYTSVPWLFATFTDLVAGGLVTDVLIQRGWDASRVRKTVLVCGTTFGLGIVGAAHAHTAMRALIWISVSIGGLSAASPIGWSIPSMIAPRGSVGTVGGIINLSNQLSGICRADYYRLRGRCDEVLRVGLRHICDLSVDWDQQLYLPARQD